MVNSATPSQNLSVANSSSYALQTALDTAARISTPGPSDPDTQGGQDSEEAKQHALKKFLPAVRYCIEECSRAGTAYEESLTQRRNSSLSDSERVDASFRWASVESEYKRAAQRLTTAALRAGFLGGVGGCQLMYHMRNDVGLSSDGIGNLVFRAECQSTDRSMADWRQVEKDYVEALKRRSGGCPESSKSVDASLAVDAIQVDERA